MPLRKLHYAHYDMSITYTNNFRIAHWEEQVSDLPASQIPHSPDSVPLGPFHRPFDHTSHLIILPKICPTRPQLQETSPVQELCPASTLADSLDLGAGHTSERQRRQGRQQPTG